MHLPINTHIIYMHAYYLHTYTNACFSGKKYLNAYKFVSMNDGGENSSNTSKTFLNYR